MTSAFDRYGLAISTRDEGAASAYRHAVDCILAAWPGASDALDQAIAADPEFALAHAARARLHAMYARGTEAKTSIATAQRLAAAHGTERERSHIEVLSNAINGQSARALVGAQAHLEQWPRDAFIMFMMLGAFGLLAFSGRADHDQARVDLCDKYSADYGNDWWFLTYQGWAYTENGNVRLGRAISDRAFAARRENANAVHGLAHAMFEDGSVSEADALLRAWMPTYDASGIQHGHLTWHWALLALEQQNPDRALALFTSKFRPSATLAAPLNVVTDGISVLWRLFMDGQHVPEDAWREVADYSKNAFPAASVAFADAHMGLLAAATGNSIELDQRVAELEQRLAQGTLAAGPVVPAVCRAARAFVDEDYRKCAGILAPLANEIVRLGGSHAQREVFEDTLLVALIKSGDVAQARSVLDQRIHRRPSRLHDVWLAQPQG
jgi:tetratricopeptide (TPR) repeat protein